MPDQRYTLVIVPHDTSHLRKIKISARFVLSVLIGLGIFAVIGIGAVVQSVKLNLEARKYQNLEQDNLKLRNNLAKSQLMTQQLSAKLANLGELSNKLRIMTGLPLDPAKPPLKLGIGGATMDFTIDGLLDPERLLNLQKRADSLENSLTVLKNYLQDKNSQLSATPSVLPAQGYMSSNFGARQNPFTDSPDFHEGIDISNDIGTPVVATADGIVIFTGQKGAFGNVIELQHDSSVSTLYGHLQKFLVKPGDHVTRWQTIGLMGNSGRSTGPHVHYEVHVNNQPVNPLPYILDLDSIAG